MGEGRRSDPSGNGVLPLAEVTRLYYLNNLTQQHIAERLKVSRSKVSRMLSEARSSSLVGIRVHSPLMLATDPQDALKGRLGLRECLVLAVPEASSGTPDVMEAS